MTGKGRGEAGRERDLARELPSQTGIGTADPLNTSVGATPTISGTSARRNVLSSKGYVRLEKRGCSEFIILLILIILDHGLPKDICIY